MSFDARLSYWLRSWIARSDATEVSVGRKAVGTIFAAIILAGAPAALGLTVVWKWLVWFLCFALAVGYVLPDWFPEIRTFPARTKRAGFGIAMIVFIFVFYPMSYNQWRREKSKMLEGLLVAKGPIPILSNYNFSQNNFIVETGNGGVYFSSPKAAPSPLPFFGDKLLFYRGKNGTLEVSTVVRDRQGNLIADIQDNVWKISPENASDKNYDDSCLEIKDARGRIALQMCLFTNGVQLQEVTHDQNGKEAYAFVKITDNPNPQLGALYAFCVQPGDTRCDDATIIPLFKYRSEDHWSERVN